MTLSDVLQWSTIHASTVATLCLLVGLGGLSLIAVYRVALALATLRAWWRGGSWLGGRSTDHAGGAGGRSSEYARVMASPGWRRRRREAIRRAGHRCQECGARGPLDVHHLTYRDMGQERPWQLAALCPPCHQAQHRQKGAA